MKNHRTIWSRPIGERAGQWLAAVALLLFGLSGFVDMAEGSMFPSLKLLALALGVAVVLGLAIHRFKERRDAGQP